MEKFWKIFDKVGNTAFWILGPLAGLIIIVVWLFQPSDADINAAIEDVERSEQVYSMAVINYTERQLNGINGEEPTPCEIYHKIVYYIDKKLLDPSSLSNGQMVYDFKSFGCSQTEAPKKYRIKKKEKSVKEEVVQEQKPVTKEKKYIPQPVLSQDEVNAILIELESKYEASYSDLDNLRKRLEISIADDFVHNAIAEFKSGRKLKQQVIQQPVVNEPAVQDKGEFIEVPKAANIEPESEMIKTQQESTPINKGDCSDATLLKYTNMYENGLMSRIEYQDFVYSNGFDKCF